MEAIDHIHGNGEISEREVLSRLTEELKRFLDPEVPVRPMHGAAAIEREAIELDFIPPHKKLAVACETAEPPTLYYLKLDAGSGLFHMPSGTLGNGRDYAVHAMGRTENGLAINVDEQSFFYVASLEGLNLKLVGKNQAEEVQPQLKELGTDYERLVLKMAEYEERVERIREQVAAMPDLADGPYRYQIDLFGGGKAYKISQETGSPELLGEFGPTYNQPAIHGNFWGTQVAIIDHKLLILDEATGLAVGARISEETGRSHGFLYMRIINMEEVPHSSINAILPELLAARNSN